ncbi:MAG: hypothetical protein ACI82O_002050, partial [Patiriisocius sp.]
VEHIQNSVNDVIDRCLIKRKEMAHGDASSGVLV